MNIHYKLFSACFLLLSITVQSQVTSVSLNKGWMFSKQGDNKWKTANVPGTIHTDLLFNKLIPDPYYRDNEKNCSGSAKKTGNIKPVLQPALPSWIKRM